MAPILREELAPSARVWMVSDVHLVDGDQAYLDQFLSFLDAAAAADLDQFLVFGDLFEFWIGDRQGRQAFYEPLFHRLRGLVARGTRVGLLRGNRDFLIGTLFEAIGAEILPDEVEFDLGGQRLHLSHGDQFCIEDLSYQRARSVFRSRPIFWLSRVLPGWLGRFLARSYRGISERKKARKKASTGNRFHTIEAGLRRALAAGGQEIVVCGHIHHFAETRIELEGRPVRVLTTGAWEEEGPNYVAIEAGRPVLRRHPAS